MQATEIIIIKPNVSSSVLGEERINGAENALTENWLNAMKD